MTGSVMYDHEGDHSDRYKFQLDAIFWGKETRDDFFYLRASKLCGLDHWASEMGSVVKVLPK